MLLLAAPPNAGVLRALADGPKQQVDLRREAGSPAQTTLRDQLKRLIGAGAVTKHRRNRFPGTLEYELSPAGAELAQVADVVEDWLATGPSGALRLSDDGAKAAIRSLTDGWSTTMLRALAAGPRSLTQLDRLITGLNYPSLERRLGGMRLAGLVEAQSANGHGTPYAVTDWTRSGVAPLAAAARWERRHRCQEAPPIGRIDFETAFMLALPFSAADPSQTGSCRMAVELSRAGQPRVAGVTVAVVDGHVASCTTNLSGEANAWVHGDASAWLDALVAGADQRLEYGSDCAFARTVVTGMHMALFRTPHLRQPTGRT